MTFLIMCLEFMKVGLFAVGGGLATVPFFYELSSKYGWFTHHDILDFIAVAESTPGPIGINLATFAGFNTAGFLGGLLAACALALPSFVIILVVAKVLEKFRTNRFVVGGFRLLRPASTGLIAAAGFNILLIVFFDVEKITFDMFGRLGTVLTHVNWAAVIMFICLFLIMKTFKGHPLIYILLSAVVGILIGL